VGIVGVEVYGVLAKVVKEAYLEGPSIRVHNELQIFPNLPPTPWFSETIAVGRADRRRRPSTTPNILIETTIVFVLAIVRVKVALALELDVFTVTVVR